LAAIADDENLGIAGVRACPRQSAWKLAPQPTLAQVTKPPAASSLGAPGGVAMPQAHMRRSHASGAARRA
jgi:hypothetical protein